MDSSPRANLQFIVKEFAENWQPFLVIHVVVNFLMLLLLVPGAALLLRLAVWFSGDVVLSDQDILFYFISPVGLIFGGLLAAVYTILLLFENAALITAVRFHHARGLVSVSSVMVSLAGRLPRLFKLALLILFRIVLNTLPLLLGIALVYKALLSAYDINFYLFNKPPEWYMALAIAGLMMLVWGVRMFYLLTAWFFSLPMVLLTDIAPRDALAESARHSAGNRVMLVRALLAWLLFSLVLASLAALLTGLAADWLVPASLFSMRRLLVMMSLVSLFGYLLSFAVTFVSTAVFSLLLLNLFARSGYPVESEGLGAATSSPQQRMIGSGAVLALLVLGLLVSALVAWQLLGQVRYEDDTVVIAHRGASFAAPENTIAAIKGAIESGAHWVEIDVQETVDGEVVVIHDSDLKKVGGVSLTVARSTLEELQAVDIGSWFDPQFSAERIPTLDEVLALCRDRIKVNIELKYYGSQVMLEQRVVDSVERQGMADQVVVMSLSLEGIREMRRLRPNWKMGLLTSVAVGNLGALDLDFLAINARFASRQAIRRLHKQGRQVLVWTVNDPVGMSVMATRGVDGIITDEPAMAMSVMTQRQELEPAERLLMQLADIFQKPSLYREQ